jgi:Domain of unknown function (DUF4386)
VGSAESSDRLNGPSTLAAITPAQRTAARIVGFLYVFQMAVEVFGESYVRERLVVAGDATKTALNIMADERLFRLSIAGDLVTYTSVIVLIWAFYAMVRPVNRNLALRAAFFRLVENAVLCVATVNSLIVLRLLSGAVQVAICPQGHCRLGRLCIAGDADRYLRSGPWPLAAGQGNTSAER